MKEEHLKYLDNLRKSGATNMMGAAPYLMEAYPDLTSGKARDIHQHWMKTFAERHPR
jgi:hypothetical protein|tara:strand:- start:3584 stop:3754 length:171 start_codon:yes stop_codon:yes gene_type:complete